MKSRFCWKTVLTRFIRKFIPYSTKSRKIQGQCHLKFNLSVVRNTFTFHRNPVPRVFFPRNSPNTGYRFCPGPFWQISDIRQYLPNLKELEKLKIIKLVTNSHNFFRIIKNHLLFLNVSQKVWIFCQKLSICKTWKLVLTCSNINPKSQIWS